MDLMVRAKRRALPVVIGKSSNVRRATVLVHITLPGRARSSALLQGSSWWPSTSACARRSSAISDINASYYRFRRGWSVLGIVLMHLIKIGNHATNEVVVRATQVGRT